jgi:hypothetical protein
MTDRDDLRERLDAVEDALAPADTAAVVVLGPGDADAYPDGIDPSDVTARREEPGVDPDEPLIVEETIVPIHRPPEYRGGVVVMTGADAARVFDSMPAGVVDRERERRAERGEPIPEVIRT